jgi:DNA adenine methylase
LTRVELDAGRSSQSTLLGRDEVTFESLYLSQDLTKGLVSLPTDYIRPNAQQYVLLEQSARYA